MLDDTGPYLSFKFHRFGFLLGSTFQCCMFGFEPVVFIPLFLGSPRKGFIISAHMYGPTDILPEGGRRQFQ